MDRITKALLLGLAITVAYTAASRMSEKYETTAQQVFLFPQLSVSAAADRHEKTDSEDVEFAFKLSEILDSFK